MSQRAWQLSHICHIWLKLTGLPRLSSQSLASGVGWAGAEGGAEGAWARLQDAVRRAERAGSGLRAAAEAGAA